MSAVCQLIGPFFDDELSQTDADEFREHLAECATCEEELHHLMQIGVVEAEAPQEECHPARVAPRTRKRLWGFGALAAAVAATISIFAVTPGAERKQTVAFHLAPTRSIEGRFSYAGADHYRPYDVQRSGAGDAPENIPLATLAELERHGDVNGLFAGHLLTGNRKQAAVLLDAAEKSANVLSDRALVTLLRGDAELALGHAVHALEINPKHPQAMWNQALILRQLKLPLSAAESFEAVAKLGEPGWRDEAEQFAGRLRDDYRTRKEHWHTAEMAGKMMVAAGTMMATQSVQTHAGLAREFLYHAVRAAPSKERVQALLPLAKKLDGHHGGHHLVAYIARVAAHFDKRLIFAEQYATLVAKNQLDGEAQFLTGLRKHGHDDILLGALLWQLVNASAADASFDEIERLAEAAADPWLQIVAFRVQADRLYDKDRHYLSAEVVLRKALRLCEETQIEYVCGEVHAELGRVYSALHQLRQARKHFDLATQQLAAGGNFGAEATLRKYLSLFAHARRPRYAGLVRAYVNEFGLAGGGCADKVRHHIQLAYDEWAHGRLTEAQGELDTVVMLQQDECNAEKPTLNQTYLASVLLPETGENEKTAMFRRVIGEQRALLTIQWMRTTIDHAEGRFLIQRNPARAERLLYAVIAEGQRQTANQVVERIALESYMVLALDAGRKKKWATAFPLVAKQLRIPTQRRCAVGITYERQRVIVALDAQGQASGEYLPLGQGSHEKKIPARLQAALRGCELVDVFADGGYYGQPGLLQDDIAWRYRSSANRNLPAAASNKRAKRLVVAVPTAPASLGLPVLRQPAVDAETLLLAGDAATPKNVLRAMRDATQIEFHAHGLLMESATSVLVLAPDSGGGYTLSASQVAQSKLTGAPLVILAACHAGRTTLGAYTSWGLAEAFLQAGARTVIASPAPIQDKNAAEFFAALRQRIAKGVSPAQALRELRAATRSEIKTPNWVSNLIVFE